MTLRSKHGQVYKHPATSHVLGRGILRTQIIFKNEKALREIGNELAQQHCGRASDEFWGGTPWPRSKMQKTRTRRARRAQRTKSHELKVAALFDLTKSLAHDLIM